jgi:hypothetical protein
MRIRTATIILGLGLTAALAGTCEAVQRRAFVTSVFGTGDLTTWPDASGSNALQRADAVCRARAQAGGLDNAATFRAWLSTGTTDAFCHVQGLSGKRSAGCGTANPPVGGPWYNTNDSPGRPFLPTLAEVTDEDGSPYGPAQFDEFGDSVSPLTANDRVWTGTSPDGSVWDDFHCSNWSSAVVGGNGASGLAHGSAVHWTTRGTYDCSQSARLLCLEPGASDAVDLPWLPGSLVFVTSAGGSGDLASWPEAVGATGLAAGDAICRTLATAAHLPSPPSFVAWLSTGAVDAIERITSDGPFRRVDRLQIAGTADGLADGALGDTLHVDENGDRLDVVGFTWTGTSNDGTAEPERCLNWSSDDPGDEGAHGLLSNSAPWWTDDLNYSRTCNQFHHLYCFSNEVTLFWDGFEKTGDLSRWSVAVP